MSDSAYTLHISYRDDIVQGNNEDKEIVTADSDKKYKRYILEMFMLRVYYF